jgi:hypothetical protein
MGDTDTMFSRLQYSLSLAVSANFRAGGVDPQILSGQGKPTAIGIFQQQTAFLKIQFDFFWCHRGHTAGFMRRLLFGI